MNNTETKLSTIIDDVFAYFKSLGTDRIIDEDKHRSFFSEDFEMIINGKTVVKGLDKLKIHFEHLLEQAEEINFRIAEKIITDDKCIIRYDISIPNKSLFNVIAIFKFRDKKIFEMNEVVNVVAIDQSIDFTSK